MEHYIHEENIRRYRKLLESERDEETQIIIRRVLAEEEAKVLPPRPKWPLGKHP